MSDSLLSIFASFDAFDQPFQAHVRARMLMYPTNGYILHKEQFDAIAAAARRAAADPKAFCIITEGADVTTAAEALESHEFRLDSYESYSRLGDELPIVQENAIVPASGAWGVLISQEFHALPPPHPSYKPQRPFRRAWGPAGDGSLLCLMPCSASPAALRSHQRYIIANLEPHVTAIDALRPLGAMHMIAELGANFLLGFFDLSDR